ncbi:MAG: ABC transporter ATP-binding protein [Nocardioidaceae bacterium]
MIEFRSVSVTYEGARSPVLDTVDVTVDEGELCLVVGPSGAGKSTLLRCVNGLVPHFTGGTLAGDVLVDGRSIRDNHPRDLADVVGYVGQDPAAGFVTDSVEDELAYAMESLAVPPAVMRKRVEETLDLLGIVDVRGRPLATLSAGQQQRVAIGAVLTASPRVLVLDEPTSALDPQGADEVLAALRRLVHDLGVTILLAEHRLERVVQLADRVLLLAKPGGRAVIGLPADVLATSPLVPPVVELGRLAGWAPVPLTVRDARRRAPELLERLPAGDGSPAPPRAGRSTAPPAAERQLARADGLGVGYRGVPALRGVDCTLISGQVVAVMGRNGSGKSTLLKALMGMVSPTAGSVAVGGRAPASLRPSVMVTLAGLVPQQPTDILYTESVAEECRTADSDAGAPAGTCRALVTRLAPDVPDDRHPRDLSEGQRLVLALCVVLTAAPPLLLLDEPTRGLDYQAKRRLVAAVQAMVADGHGVVLATHDVELVADVAQRVVILAEGQVVADGSTADVVASSAVFAPQVATVLSSPRWLTVSDVAASLAASPSPSSATSARCSVVSP